MYNRNTDWVEALQPGDLVFVVRGSHTSKTSVHKVDRITKTLVVLSTGERFRRADGEAPGDGWHKPSLERYSEDRLAEIAAEKLERANRRKISEVSWLRLDAAKIAEVVAVLGL